MKIFYSICLLWGLGLGLVQGESFWPVDENGDPYFVKGVTFTIKNSVEAPAAMQAALRDLKEMGGNTIRTWGVGDETRALLDAAHAEGIKVLLGLWLEHGRDGAEGDGDMNYRAHTDRTRAQTERVLRQVARYHEHPALLGWGVGNEVILNISTEEQKIAYAKYLEELCQEIRTIDPVHPLLSVSAFTTSVPYWVAYTPSLDGYGINAYGPAAGAIPDVLKQLGASKPYLVTEFGPRGAWDSPKDEFGVPQMPSDGEKYDQISRGWGEWIESHRPRGCVGGFVFNFGDDDSPTSIWLDFYVKGLKRPAYWATREAFTGKKPEQELESLEGMLVSPTTVESGQVLKVGLEPLHAGDAGEVSFVFSPEFGGRDHMNHMLPVAGEKVKERMWKLKVPTEPGVYRLYALKSTQGNSLTITQASVRVIVP